MKKKTFDDILCISMSEGSLAQGDLGPCDVHLNKLEQGGTYVLSRLSFSFLFFFLACFIAVVSIVFYVILALWPPVRQFQCFVFCVFYLF